MIRPSARPSSTRSSKTPRSVAEVPRPASRTAPLRHSRPATAMCLRWVPSRALVVRACRAPAVRGIAGRDRLGGGSAGGQPGRHGVVDALAGHRVDQPRGVADQQHRPALGRGPAVRERQLVADPVGGAVGGRRAAVPRPAP